MSSTFKTLQFDSESRPLKSEKEVDSTQKSDIIESRAVSPSEIDPVLENDEAKRRMKKNERLQAIKGWFRQSTVKKMKMKVKANKM